MQLSTSGHQRKAAADKAADKAAADKAAADKADRYLKTCPYWRGHHESIC